MEKSASIIETQDTLALKKLLSLAEKLKGIGLTPCYRLFTLKTLQDPTADAGFPVVEDGLNGIRCSYRKGELALWFTNSFEKKDNETRKKVEEIWKNLN